MLTPGTVGSAQFGKRFSYAVDGQIYAQPLYVPNVALPGQGTHNVVYVVTEHNSVYAFDADGNTPAPLWQVSFLANGGTTVPNSDVGCGQIAPEIGITGTPVIDPATNTIYMVAMTKESGSYFHRLHALDITTGMERTNSPVVIQASVPGSGDGGSTVTFVPKNYKARSGLLLLNGTVYTSWASHCDIGLYHGWIMAYDATSLKQIAVYNNTANARGASFWTSGAAPAVDPNGNIFVNGGNGSFDANTGGTDLGESFIKLTPGANSLTAADYFTPYNFADLDNRDLDTGSSGVLLLPDSAGSAAHPHLLTSAGKEGRIYLLDRDNLGKWQANSDSQIVQSIPGAVGGLFGIPAYFNNTLYFSGSSQPMKAFSIQSARMSTTPTSATAFSFGNFGGVPSISANGTSNGIVWLLQSAGGGPGLFAYDATDLTKLLFNSNASKADALGSYVKFSTPTVANGRVYAGTSNALVVYGLAANPQVSAVVSAGSYQAIAAPGSLISIFGANLTAAPGQATQYPLPVSIGGVSVTVSGKTAPLYYAGPSQVNAQVPVDAPLGTAPVTVSTAAGPLAPMNLAIQATAPAILAVVNAGGFLTVYLTGIGPLNNPPTTGAAASGNTSTATLPVSATLGGTALPVTFAGAAPGFAGLAQINLGDRSNLVPGTYPVVVTVGGVPSNIVQVSIGN